MSAILFFLILWFFLFFSAIAYLKPLRIIKNIFCLNFKEISKVEFWISFFMSLLIAAVISYSLVG